MTSDKAVRLPPEWAPQDWLWIGFPHDPAEWGDALGQAQEEIAGFANAVAESGQEVRLLVRDAANEARAKGLVSGAVTLERRTYGDVWLRDTGPIMVEGAEPGDVLCVYIQDISVAEHGVSVIRPKGGLLGSEIRKPFVYQAKISEGRVVINEELSVPLKPVVGILGVAPRHGEIKTEYPGRHGGNMDTLDLTVGSRIFLPVQVNGGLLALGSVKACMGDGQVTGTGVEVAAEVTVRVDILPGGRYSWPRLETKENYITITSASSVAQAGKLAVMEMVRWLEQEKGLDFETAYLVAGISGNLHISQWSNPLMTARMVLPRAVMNKIQGRSATGTRPIHMDTPDETIEEHPELEQPIPDSPPEPVEDAQEIKEAAEASLTSTDEGSPGERTDSQQRRRRWRRRRPSILWPSSVAA
mgnify:CR=1 FL=1